MLLGCVSLCSAGWGQNPAGESQPKPVTQSQTDAGPFGSPNFGLDQVMKKIDDLLWYQKMGDIADVDKCEYAGLPSDHVKNKKAIFDCFYFCYSFTSVICDGD